MKTKIAVIIGVLSLCVLPLRAQQEPIPFQSPAYTQVYGYDGNGNVSYVCFAKSWVGQNQSVVTAANRNAKVAISAATNANPVVFTSTGHGLVVGAQPAVIISGGTGNWAAANTTAARTVVATVIDANTFSIPVDSTTFGALAGTVKFQTTAPRQTVAEWAVLKYLYDGSNRVINKIWLGGHSLALDQKCSDATSTTVTIQ